MTHTITTTDGETLEFEGPLVLTMIDGIKHFIKEVDIPIFIEKLRKYYGSEKNENR